MNNTEKIRKIENKIVYLAGKKSGAVLRRVLERLDEAAWRLEVRDHFAGLRN
jgi:hypothetical protein